MTAGPAIGRRIIAVTAPAIAAVPGAPAAPNSALPAAAAPMPVAPGAIVAAPPPQSPFQSPASAAPGDSSSPMATTRHDNFFSIAASSPRDRIQVFARASNYTIGPDD